MGACFRGMPAFIKRRLRVVRADAQEVREAHARFTKVSLKGQRRRAGGPGCTGKAAENACCPSRFGGTPSGANSKERMGKNGQRSGRCCPISRLPTLTTKCCRRVWWQRTRRPTRRCSSPGLQQRPAARQLRAQFQSLGRIHWRVALRASVTRSPGIGHGMFAATVWNQPGLAAALDGCGQGIHSNCVSVRHEVAGSVSPTGVRTGQVPAKEFKGVHGPIVPACWLTR